jgi:hypothetical protein
MERMGDESFDQQGRIREDLVKHYGGMKPFEYDRGIRFRFHRPLGTFREMHASVQSASQRYARQ